ncbi:11654_t:CDS:2, partial [Diversispora eburnea]
MLACPDPTPLAFFQFIFPSHQIKASEKYKKVLDLAFKEAVDEELHNKFEEMKKSTNILVRRNIHNTNLSLHEEINMLSLNKDGSLAKNMKSDSDLDTSEHLEEEEESEDEIDKFFMDKENNEKICNDITSNDIGNINFMECIEESKLMSSTCQHPWVLHSGTNVGDKLASYVKTISEIQKCL